MSRIDKINTEDFCDLDESIHDVELDFRVVILKELLEDWQDFLGSELLTDDGGHFTQGCSSSGFELSCGISIGVLKCW